jgi:hypothetical protein
MHQMSISTNKVFSVMLRPKKCEIRKIWESYDDNVYQEFTGNDKVSIQVKNS